MLLAALTCGHGPRPHPDEADRCPAYCEGIRATCESRCKKKHDEAVCLRACSDAERMCLEECPWPASSR